MGVLIRRAQPGDAGALAELRWEFRAREDTPAEERRAFVERCRRWMSDRLREPDSGWTCRVVDEGRDLVGQMWIEIVEKVPNPVYEEEGHAYLTASFLRPAFRGSGIGSELLGTGLDWCRGRDVGSVILWPTEGSRSLYRRRGFERAGGVMELSVQDGRSGGQEPGTRRGPR